MILTVLAETNRWYLWCTSKTGRALQFGDSP